MLAFLFLLEASFAGPLDVAGVWATENGRAQVEIVETASGSVRGEIIWFASYGEEGERNVLGETLLRGFEQEGERWSNGMITNLKNGQDYRSSLKRTGADTLEVEGCLLVFCRGQKWTRVPEAEVRRIDPDLHAGPGD